MLVHALAERSRREGTKEVSGVLACTLQFEAAPIARGKAGHQTLTHSLHWDHWNGSILSCQTHSGAETSWGYADITGAGRRTEEK